MITTVSRENWSLALDGGWRWHSNFDDMEGGLLLLAHLTVVYGAGLVIIGPPFGVDGPLSYAALAGLGIYLCDLTELISEIHEDISNFECGFPLPEEETI